MADKEIDDLDILNHEVRNEILLMEACLKKLRQAIRKFEEARRVEGCRITGTKKPEKTD